MGASALGGSLAVDPRCAAVLPVGRWAWLSSANALPPLDHCVYGDDSFVVGSLPYRSLCLW